MTYRKEFNPAATSRMLSKSLQETSKKAPKLAYNQHLLDKEIDVTRYVQFKFHDIGSCGIAHECICKQNADLKEALDSFFEESFGCPITKFKSA